MPAPLPSPDWTALAEALDGELLLDEASRTLYATDASAYRERPLAVALPASEEDLGRLVAFGRRHGLPLIPRATGTSLAGQVVGAGLVVDVSRHLDRVLDLDPVGRTVTVQPGVIRDDLNRLLAPHGLFFAPETSTANRATIGGMAGNNSCGANSVVYGSTREHLLAIEGYLADGGRVRFTPLDEAGLEAACSAEGLEGDVWRLWRDWRADQSLRDAVREAFPKPGIPRRNTGYALDLMLGTEPLPHGSTHPAQAERRRAAADPLGLLCGSEGTLLLTARITLSLEPLPPPHAALVCAHFNSVDEALRGNLVALRHAPHAVELMDHYIFSCTAGNRTYAPYRFFLQGDPQAVLVVALHRETEGELERTIQELERSFRNEGLGYAFPVVRGADMAKVWGLRKAGLGLLSNLPGDAKPAPVIEDTAVDVADLPAYIRDFNALLRDRGLHAVHYAHAGSGELHLRPILNLKTAEGQAGFRRIAEDVAALVKRYRGSLSGEHGDGRLRGEFIRGQVGDALYDRMRALKRAWDPEGLFNPGKITDAPPMDEALRYTAGQATPDWPTGFRWTATRGVLRAAEQCNGSGDCRKPAAAGGTMCPSYQATRREADSTRARANLLREVLGGRHPSADTADPWTHPDLEAVLDLCLACKGCTAECPSNVDMARLKSEWLHQRHRRLGVPWRHRLFAEVNRLNALGSRVAPLHNALMRSPVTAPWLKRMLGVHPDRSLPRVHGRTLRRWMARARPEPPGSPRGTVWFYADAFTDLLDADTGREAVLLLTRLGYAVRLAPAGESGRAHISKGLLDRARRLADRNVAALSVLKGPIVGLEPSEVLSFRDEYPDLVSPELETAARDLAPRVFLFEEFLVAEAEAGRLGPEDFPGAGGTELALHGHCHQKALAGVGATARILDLAGYGVQVLATGCCGMAGSFGYEREHHALSLQVGELALFPALRTLPDGVGIAAPGTSCRHQILDGTGREAWHPARWLYRALG